MIFNASTPQTRKEDVVEDLQVMIKESIKDIQVITEDVLEDVQLTIEDAIKNFQVIQKDVAEDQYVRKCVMLS